MVAIIFFEGVRNSGRVFGHRINFTMALSKAAATLGGLQLERGVVVVGAGPSSSRTIANRVSNTNASLWAASRRIESLGERSSVGSSHRFVWGRLPGDGANGSSSLGVVWPRRRLGADAAPRAFTEADNAGSAPAFSEVVFYSLGWLWACGVELHELRVSESVCWNYIIVLMEGGWMWL